MAQEGVERLGPGDHARSIEHGDRKRQYIVHVPPKYDPARPAPVILAFHGAAMTGEKMVKFTGLNETADREGFIAVYPSGTGAGSFLTWNAGGFSGRMAENRPDDVGFVSAMLDDLAKRLSIDQKRIYACGMSNGGMMCYRLAAELSHRIAAIAPIAGTMAIEQCHPKRPVSVLHFHGTKDGLVLYGGPDERTPKNLKFLSVEATIRAWVNANGCPETPRTLEVEDPVQDGTSVRAFWYGPGKDNAEVVLYAIEGGGHTWPGRDPQIRFLGKSTRKLSANDLMWDFFQKHPLALKSTGSERVDRGPLQGMTPASPAGAARAGR